MPILFAPILDIVPVAPPDLPPGTLILTSEAGARRARDLGLADRPAWAVGPRTAAVARAAGFACETGPGDAEGLWRAIADRGAGPFLHLHGRHVALDIAGRLRAAGIAAESRVVYDQRAAGLSDAARIAIARGRAILPLYSARSARLVAAALDAPPAPSLRVVAMSGGVADAWPYAGVVGLAERPDAAAMRDTLVGLVASTTER